MSDGRFLFLSQHVLNGNVSYYRENEYLLVTREAGCVHQGGMHRLQSGFQMERIHADAAALSETAVDRVAWGTQVF